MKIEMIENGWFTLCSNHNLQVIGRKKAEANNLPQLAVDWTLGHRAGLRLSLEPPGAPLSPVAAIDAVSVPVQ